jgi:Ni/Fe-hydrogenase subunit HybB-like protein/Fe-S-cluster-containing dehydrogenase component
MSITRRTAIQTLAAAGAAAVVPKSLWARSPREPSPDAVAILFDSTYCIGCQECIRGCASTSGCEETATQLNPSLSPLALTVLQRHETNGGSAFVKMQCMHCVDPACVSACMLGAMQKQADGAVTWNGDLCVGCRYCQIACPFTVPRFEWDTPVPELMKCDLCVDRRAAGQLPACVDQCRRGALAFGSRESVLEEAHRRLEANPRRYNGRVYGEQEAGGTSVLYLAKAGVSFAEIGLPELSSTSVPTVPETIQHTLYKGMIAPLALFGMFAAVVRRNARRLHEAAADHQHERSEPVGTKILTGPFVLLAALAIAGVIAVGYRLLVGLGPTTNLSDGYPMGLWIAFDVVTGTALACGGYAVALLVYLLNRGKYHPLVRAAIVTSALGYTLGGLSVVIDIGRWWNAPKIFLYFWNWNFNSILLEVALCIMLYTLVLWIEVSPAFLERWQEAGSGRLKRFAAAASPKIERAMPYMIALGLLLPTMHQSSLGSLMLMAGAKLHPLWYTPLLPALFLVSCVAMGYAAVTLESLISARVFNRPRETPMLRSLAGPISIVLLAYVLIRIVDVVARGKLGLVLAMDGYSFLFMLEMALFAVPALGLLVERRSAAPGFLLTVGVAVILAGALYRFSTFLIAFNPGPQWSYFPSLLEFTVTIGLVSAEILAYVVIVKKFPILRGVPSDEALMPPEEPSARAGKERGARQPAPGIPAAAYREAT